MFSLRNICKFQIINRYSNCKNVIENLKPTPISAKLLVEKSEIIKVKESQVKCEGGDMGHPLIFMNLVILV